MSSLLDAMLGPGASARLLGVDMARPGEDKSKAVHGHRLPDGRIVISRIDCPLCWSVECRCNWRPKRRHRAIKREKVRQAKKMAQRFRGIWEDVSREDMEGITREPTGTEVLRKRIHGKWDFGK